jgi:phosphotransferase system enzyme I (PtsP)
LKTRPEKKNSRAQAAGAKQAEQLREAGVPEHARVHERGNARLDSVLDFLAFAARSMPLVALLDEAPRRLASVVGASVASLYLLEGDGETLVMRGNVGFSARVLGQVRLKLGEGITGAVVQIQRPISVLAAAKHDSYRDFPELDEGRFPVFCAVPIMGRRGPLGAMVVQREGHEPFSDADVELLAALSATVAAAVRAAELTDTARDRNKVSRKAGGGTRKVTLTGRPIGKGRVVGAVAALKRPPSRPREARHVDDVARLKSAFEIAEKSLLGLAESARFRGLEGVGFLDTYLQIVSDSRLRKEAIRLCQEGKGVAEALGQITRRVAAAAVTGGSSFLEERAHDIEDLCDALAMMASSDPRAELPTRALLLADRLTVFDVLVSTKHKPVGVALSDTDQSPRSTALLALLGLPSIAEVGGLFRWASDGDVALLDADHGLLILNPSRSEVAMVREESRKQKRRTLSLPPMARDSRPPGFDMSFQPERPRRFGPPRRACLLAYVHLGLSLAFVAFVYYGYAAAPGSLAFRYVVEAAQERSFPASWFAMVVLGSGIAAVMRARMCGVLILPDGIQSFELLYWSLPRVRRLDWPVIDRLRFDSSRTISVDLWNGTREYLPEVQEHQELAQALAYIAEARAIPYVGDPGIAFDESYLATRQR